MGYTLNESISDTIIVYLIVKKISTPFNEWKAYKLGIIDENGKKLKEPISFKERESWTIFDKFCANAKKVITKFAGPSRAAALLTAAFLLREAVVITSKELSIVCNEEMVHLSAAKQLEIKKIINSCRFGSKSEFIFDEAALAFSVEKYYKLVEPIAKKSGTLEAFDVNGAEL